MELKGIRTYRIRGSRITEAQQKARERLASLHEITTREPIDLRALFPGISNFVLEIGFGMGEATALIAESQRDTGFVAVEVHPPGVGKLLALIDEKELSNIKIINEDVHVVLDVVFPDHSFDGVHIFFPDPWPKTKHHKRRIINEEFLSSIAPKIKDGGYIHIATDWVPYAEWIKKVFGQSELFSGGEVERPSWRPITRFEGQGITKNHRVTDLRYIKN